MLAIAPKVFREALSSQVRIDDGSGRVMEFKLSDADLWVRRLTEETQSSLRSAVEQSVAQAVDGSDHYLFPFVSLKNLAHGKASDALLSLVSPHQAKPLSDLTISEVIEAYDAATAVKLAAWLQGTKGIDVDVESLKAILGLNQPLATSEAQVPALGREALQTSPEPKPVAPVALEASSPPPVKAARAPAAADAAKKAKPASSATTEPPVQLELPKLTEPTPGLATKLPTKVSRPAPLVGERRRGRPKTVEAAPVEQAIERCAPSAPPPDRPAATGPALAVEPPPLVTAPAQVASDSKPAQPSVSQAQPSVSRDEPAYTGTAVDDLAKAWVASEPVIERSVFEEKLKRLGLVVPPQVFLQNSIDEDALEASQSGWLYLELSGIQLVCRPEVGFELNRVHNLCLRHIEASGAACVAMAATKASAAPQDADKLKALAIAQFEKIDGFTWLDQTTGWFYIKRYKSRVIKTILKIMSACRKLSLEELMAGVYKSKTGLGPPISKDIFRKLCKHTAGLQVYKDDVVAAKRGWCKQDRLLSEVDQKLVRLFQGRRKVITFQALVQHFTDRGGLTTATALAAPELHPLLKKVAPMLYTLRGVKVEINPW